MNTVKKKKASQEQKKIKHHKHRHLRVGKANFNEVLLGHPQLGLV